METQLTNYEIRILQSKNVGMQSVWLSRTRQWMDEKTETRSFCRSWDLCILRRHLCSLYVPTVGADDIRRPSRHSTRI
jgi:hypothetical protein